MEGLFLPQGVWISQTPAAVPGSGGGLILDRDGVVVEEKHYLHRPDDVVLMPGIASMIMAARQAGMMVIMATNQSGIARGYFGWAEFLAVEERIAALLAEQDVALDLKIACPFHPDFTPGYGKVQDYWRKPGPGMIDFALKSLALEPSASVMVGDKAADVAAARAAGLTGAYYVRGHHHDQGNAALNLATSSFFVTAVDCLSDIPDDFGLGRARRQV